MAAFLGGVGGALAITALGTRFYRRFPRLGKPPDTTLPNDFQMYLFGRFFFFFFFLFFSLPFCFIRLALSAASRFEPSSFVKRRRISHSSARHTITAS